MKTKFTNLHFNKTFNRLLAACVVLLMSINAFAQVTATENFEDEAPVPISSPFKKTNSQGGINFVMTGRLKITGSPTSTAGANGSNYFMDSNDGPLSGSVTGNIGSFSINNTLNPSTAFRVNSFAGYVASDITGNNNVAGAVTFIGTKVDNTTVSETVTIPANPNVQNGITFTGNLAGVYLTSLAISLPSGVQYIEIDDINFTTQAVVTNQFSISDVSQLEGNNGTSTFQFTVTRSNNSAASSVQVQSSDGTATSGSDYVAFPLTTVNFTAGTALTQTVNVTVNGDATIEPDETFTMTLSNPTGGVILDATGTGTILDDDASIETFETEADLATSFSEATVNFQSSGKFRVNTASGLGATNSNKYLASTAPFATGNQGAITVTSSGKSINMLSVDLWTANVVGATYTPTTATVTFTGTKADGTGTVTHTASITPTNPSGTGHIRVSFAGTPFANVPILSMAFSISSGVNYLQVDNFTFSPQTISGTQVSINDISILEGTGSGNTAAVFTITRTNNTSAFSVDVASSNGTATAGTDYVAFPTTTLNFTNGGALTQTVTVLINKDATTEPNETFNMTLSNPTNGTLYLKQVGIGTINNDDGSIGETFEDETASATTFTENSVAFSATGGYQVRSTTNAGSGSSAKFLTSNNNVVGSMGTFSVTTPNTAFKIVSLDAWVGTSTTAFSSGPVTFTGTLLGGGTVSTTKTITATNNTGTGWQQGITFTGTPLDNVNLTALQIISGGSLTAVDIDNFNFTVVNTLPIIEVVDASNNAITNGGVAGTANNTDFGLRCLTGGTQSKTYTIKNSGNTNLTLSGSPLAVLGGTDASQFSITSQPTSPIAPGGTTTFTVLFDPNAGGAKNATVTLTSNDATNSPYVINIKGIGAAEPTATIGTIPDICAGATSFTIPFTNPSANPTAYSVSGNGITTVTDIGPANSPILVNLSTPAVFGTNPSFTFSLRNGNGCRSPEYTGSVTVTAGPPATITPTPTAVCVGGIINLSAPAGASTYLWSGNGIVLANSNATTAVPTASGAQTYGLTVTDAAGCSTVATTSVTVNANPIASPSSNTPVCAGNTLNLTSTTATSYLWTGPNSFSSTLRNPDINNVSILAGGTYTLRVTNADGCTATATTAVVINSTQAPTAPTATPSSRTTAGSVTLSASGCSGGTLTWYNASTNVAVPSPNNQPSFSSSGTFNFYAKCTGTNTCVSNASANVSVTVSLCTPLASSPGNIGINWTGLEGTDWNNPCNWNPAWVPDATNSAVVINLRTNQPTISGTVPSVGQIYVNSGATLTVSSGGTLNSNSTVAAITLQGGNIINDGTINTTGGGSSVGLAIGATASIINRGTITTNNLYGASLQFGDLTFTNESTGIYTGDFKANAQTLTLTNRGTINYGVGTYAISLGSAGSSVVNDGTINITGGSGISNPSGSTITNNACGKILTASGYENGGITTNAGLIQMPFLINTGTFTNNGVVKANSVSGITNNRMVITNACPIFTLAGSNNYTVSGIFTNAGATTSAGTYTSVGNKFTANNTIPTGTQTLYAQVTNGTCTFVVPFDFNNVKPTSVSVNNSTICTGASVTLSASCESGTPTWYTTATGGSNIGTGASLSQSPTAATTYYVACETTNCVSGRVATNQVTVSSPPTASASSNSPICAGSTLNLTGGASGNTYLWTGPNSFTSTELSPSITNTTVSLTGTYTIRVTNASSCTSTATTAVTVNATPTATASSNSPICVGNTINLTGGGVGTYAWSGPNGYSSTAQSPTIASAAVSASGTYTIRVTGAGNCTSTATTAVTVNAVTTASVTPSTQTICSGETITTIAIAGTGASYTWTRDNTGSVTGIAASGSGDISGSLTNTTEAPVTVTFTVTPVSACSGTPVTATVVVNPIPTVVASTPSQTICSGAGITGIRFNLPTPVRPLTPDPTSDVAPTTPAESIQGIGLSSFVAGTVFNWTRDNTATVTGIPASGTGNITGVLINTTASPITVTFTVTPSYANDGKVCMGTPITVTVTVNPNPTAPTITDAGTAFCSGSSTTLTASADPTYTSYAWERSLTGIANPNSFTAFGGTAQTQVVTTSGVYRVVVGNQYNCFARDTTAVKFGDFVFNGSLAAGDAQQTGRMNRFATVSTCAAPKGYPGDFTTTGSRLYDSYTVTNPTSAPVCATVGLTSGCGFSLFSAAYLGSFNPTALSTNYLADPGSTFQTTAFYEATIPANGTIVVVVHEVNPGTGCSNYNLRVDVPGATVAPTASSNSPICAGNTLNLTGTGTGTYAWSGPNSFTSTEQNPSIANATTLATGTYTISVTNTSGCVFNATTAVTVNAVSTASVTPSTQTICSGETITTIAIAGTGTSYTWTRDNTGSVTGIAASGSGDISGSLTNTTEAPVTVTFTVTPVGTCSGTPVTATVVVNPIPTVVASTPSQSICSGSNITGITFNNPTPVRPLIPDPSSDVVPTAPTESIQGIGLSSFVAGTVFNWTRDNTATVTGIPASGTGNISGLLVNTTASPVTVTFTVTPSYTNAGKVCMGTPITVTVTVNPNPTAPTITDTGTAFCTGSSTTLTAPADPTYTSYAWERSLTGIANPNSFTAFGGTAQTQVVNTSGVYRVVVGNQYNCFARDTTAVKFGDFVFNGSLAAGDAQQTGRMNRFATVSTCAAPKGYPGDFTTTGSRFYDSYTVTNPTSAPVCATIGLTSGCGTSLFSAAYLGSFNPTALSTNYLADPGSSFPTTAFYEATIPANGTIVVVVHEVNPGTGCSNYNLRVDVPGATVAPTASSNSPICAGNTLNLTGTGTGTYAWSGPNSFTSTEQNPSIANATTLATGTYTISVTNASGCVFNATTAVTVNATPTATASSNSPICAGTTLNLTCGGIGTTYAWVGPNGYTSTEQSPTISNATVSSTGTYSITVTNENGCTSTASVAVTINPLPTATATNNTPICSGTTINLTGGGGGTYAWAGPSGYSSTEQSPSIANAMAFMSGTYTVTVTNANGCTSTATTSVTINPVTATPTPQANTQIIFGGSITLTATGCSGANDVLKWYQSSDNSLAVMPVSPTATTNYYAKCETTLNGITCISGNSADVTVTVLSPNPPVATGATNCLGTPTTLTATGCSGSVGTFVLKWYQNSDDALVTMPVSPATTTDYYARCEQTFNAVTATSAKSNVVTLTILNPPTPVSTGGTIYNSQSISLTATGCTGTLGTFTLKWYQTADNVEVTVPVSPTVTTQYYSKCEQTANSVTCLSAKSNDVTVTVINRIFVDVAKIAAPIQNGNSWATAYGNLQTGLGAATAGVEVWVAKGTYKPTETTTRTIYFNVPNDVKVYGGFAGTEDNLIERNFRTNISVLSGDIGTQNLDNDNSYHVVVMNGSSSATLLDGFTIKGGYANFDDKRTYSAPLSIPTTATIETGGGILIQNGSSPTIANCTIMQNAAVTGGGIFAGDASMPTIMFCKIIGNQAGFGSGIYFQDGSNGKVSNTLIAGNKGIGGVYNNNSNSMFTNVTFGGNGGLNGGIFNSNSQPIVKNSIIWGNSTPFNDTQSIITYSTIQGGYVGTGNLSVDPKFVNPMPEALSPSINGDYHVQASSLTIDRGDNGTISLTDTDLEGNLRRFAGGRVDMGAYEFQGTATATLVISVATGNWESNSTWDVGRVPQLGDYVIIDNNHIVTLNGTGIAKNLEYRGTGQLKFNSSTSKIEIGF